MMHELWVFIRTPTPTLCKWCGKHPRAFAMAFCSQNCMTLWRRFDAVQRGYIPADDYEGEART